MYILFIYLFYIFYIFIYIIYLYIYYIFIFIYTFYLFYMLFIFYFIYFIYFMYILSIFIFMYKHSLLCIKTQQRHCTYKVVLLRVRLTMFDVEEEHILKNECLYSCLSYPACKVHAPCYIVICGVSGCTIFFHIIL
jgi:hypothetical protein